MWSVGEEGGVAHNVGGPPKGVGPDLRVIPSDGDQGPPLRHLVRPLSLPPLSVSMLTGRAGGYPQRGDSGPFGLFQIREIRHNQSKVWDSSCCFSPLIVS